jgi:hypothetical protein
MGRAHVLLRALRDGKVVETGLCVITQTATEFGKLALVALADGSAALLGFLPTGCLAHIHQ